MTRRVVACALAMVVAAAVLLPGCGGSPTSSPQPVRRVLVVSLPGLTWDEARSADLPHLRALARAGAVGEVSTRIGRTLASTTAAYLTLGAGTRAVLPGVDTGVALNPGELHGGVPASELVERRLGRPTDDIAYIPVGATIDANARSLFRARPGMLGDALDEAGVHRAVIANADSAEGFPSDEPPPDGAYARGAATTLMGSDGLIPDGNVGRGLLVDDPSAAYGRRLDADAVMGSFDRAWDRPGRTVVLVEGSDLARASGYRLRSTPEQARALRAEALERTDRLLGRLLERVHPNTDAVLVVAPVAPNSLGVVVLRSPGVEPGFVRSASTRRDGYAYLADVAPTILTLVGEEPPTDIEGRAFDIAPASGDRIDVLARQSDGAEARAVRLPTLVVAVVVGLALLVAGVARRDRLPSWARRMLRPGAYVAIGVVPGSFVAGALDRTWTSSAAYALAVAVVAAAVGLVATLVERRRRGAGALVAVGSVLAVIAADLLAGAPLQVNSVFGYSMAVAGRYTGLGNLAFALFSSAAICFAVLVHERTGSRAPLVVTVVLVAAVALDGLPMLGADAGGSLSLAPAAILTVMALRGRSIGWRQVAAALLAGAVVIAVLGLIDSSRPAASKTHLARLGGQAASGRLDLVATTLWRRAEASFGSHTILIWLLALGVVGVALAQAFVLARRPAGVGRTPLIRTPGGRALAWGLGTVSVVGLVANDSSVAVPATMLIVIVPVLVLRALDTPGAPAPDGAP